jgi:hypothetical protein
MRELRGTVWGLKFVQAVLRAAAMIGRAKRQPLNLGCSLSPIQSSTHITSRLDAMYEMREMSQ